MKRITREELYAAVWRFPISKLAVDWDVLSLRIVKACELMEVPRPEDGYWQRLKHGWNMERPALPAAKAETPGSTVIENPRRRERVLDAPKVEVAAKLSSPHPLVAQMERVLREAKPHYIFSIQDVGRRQRIFRVRLTRGLIGRAMCILDAFVKAVEKRGAALKAVDEYGLREVGLGDESVSFILSEDLERRPRVAKDEEERRSWSWHPYQHHSTGRLRFEIDGYAPGNCVKRWRDCDRYRLEEKVGEMVGSVFQVFEAIGRERAQRRKEEEERQAQQRVLEEARQRQARELEYRKRLEAAALAWAKARDLRGFIAACEERMAGSGGEWQERWLVWAKAHADRLDPLTGGFLGEERKRFEEGGSVGQVSGDRNQGSGVGGQEPGVRCQGTGGDGRQGG